MGHRKKDPSSRLLPFVQTKGSLVHVEGIPGGSDGKESTCSAGDPGSIPGLGRSAGEENGYPLQYSCLENPTVRGAWRARVSEVTKSDTTEQLTCVEPHPVCLVGLGAESGLPPVNLCCCSPLSHVQLFATPWTALCKAPLSSAISQSLLKFESIESIMLSNHLLRVLIFVLRTVVGGGRSPPWL